MSKQKAVDVDEFRSALERLELSLDTPIIAGELGDWLEDLRSAWDTASEKVRVQIQNVHPRQFQGMAEQDPALIPRIEKMKIEDREIAEDCDEFHRLLVHFAEQSPQFEPDEEKVSELAQNLIDSGSALVNRARKQETVLQSYFMEAFNRDRGVAD